MSNVRWLRLRNQLGVWPPARSDTEGVFAVVSRALAEKANRVNSMDRNLALGTVAGSNRRLMKEMSRYAVLAIMPVLVGIIVALAMSSIMPYFNQGEYDYDPSYIYLFNGMGLMRGFPPGHVDHPGTPLQILTGMLSFTDWGVRRLAGLTNLGFEAAVLKDPESYLLTVSASLLLLNLLAVYYLGLRIWRATASVAIAVLAQAGYLLFASQLPRFAYVSPEALAIFSAAMTMALLSPYLFSSDPEKRPVGAAGPVLIGGFLAIGLVSKITFFPLLLLLLVIPGRGGKFLGLASVTLFSILLFAPAYSHFSQWLTFMFQIATHSEYYGAGPANVVDLAAVPQRMLAFWRGLPVLYIAILAAGLVGVVQLLRFRRPNMLFWQSGIFCAIIVASLLSAIKHFFLRYAIPSLAITPVVLAWCISQFLQTLANRHARQAVAVLSIVCTIALAAPGLSACLSSLSASRAATTQQLAPLNAIIAQHAGAIVIGGYGSRSFAYAIPFGLGYVDMAYQKIVAAGRSDLIAYPIGGNALFIVGEGFRELKVASDLVKNGKEVLFLLREGIPDPPGLKFELLYRVPNHERLLRLVDSTG
jgi:hypothetical protein